MGAGGTGPTSKSVRERLGVSPERDRKVLDLRGRRRIAPLRHLNGCRSSTHTQGILVATPQALGQRILATYHDRILIVRPGRDGGSGWPGSRSSGMWGEPVAYMLDDSGRWNRTPDPWRDALTKQLAEMERHRAVEHEQWTANQHSSFRPSCTEVEHASEVGSPEPVGHGKPGT